MGYTASALIKIAEAEVGYLEKKTNSSLDSKTANAGYNNYTKYARDLYKAGYYNGNKNGYPWCDVFHDHCHWIAAGKDAKEAQRVTCQTGPYGAGCIYSARYYRNAGRFYTTPQVGDQIFFGTKGNESHTGIVYKVDANKVYTIEGNTSSEAGVVANGGAVRKKSYSLSYSKIVGYGRPKYDAEPVKKEEPKKVETQKADTNKEVCTVEIKILRKGDKGNVVKAMQILLAGNGCKCGVSGADGSFGPATLEALKKYQAKKKLKVDGVCGSTTWAKLLGK